MKKIAWAIVAILFSGNAFAGGILTNTNQNIAFNRNMARDGIIGIDGVYSNPAGVVFMEDGFHLSVNWQMAFQTRTISTNNPDFALGMNNNGNTTKEFKGEANVPVIPSLQAAYNTGRWSLQANIAITGGGGKCEFSEGIGSFESAVGAITSTLKNTSTELNENFGLFGCNVPNVTGYDVDGFMSGKQYYIGFTLGSAYKITDNLSVYGGARLLYGTASYEARLNNIRVMNGITGMTLPEYFEGIESGLTTAAINIQAHPEAYIQAMMAQGKTLEQAQKTLQNAGTQLKTTVEKLEGSGIALAPYTNGVNLKSDQTGMGIAPIIGIDYKIGTFNFGAKYEFKTRMRMKNNSTVKEAHQIAALNKYRDGSSVPEDQPALFTIGGQWSVTPSVRVMAGYHLFFDKSAHWYNHDEDKLDGNTWEYNGGAEWDVNDKLLVSAGIQKTNYGLSDEYMNDMSFVVSSYTYGLGLRYKISDKVKVNVAYFQTNYDTYKQDVTPAATNATTHNDYTRTNRVLGVGVDITL